MKYALVLTAIAAIASKVAAVGVSGTPEGFASSATGGGNATPVYPTTTDELVSYLGDSEARVIVLSKTLVESPYRGLATADNDEMLVSTSPILRAAPRPPVVLLGVLPPAARLPSTRMTGAPTTSLMPLPLPSPSEYLITRAIIDIPSMLIRLTAKTLVCSVSTLAPTSP